MGSKDRIKFFIFVNCFRANQYINAIGGQSLYSKQLFKQHGVDINFLKTNHIEYPQFKKKFIPNLSIIDILMFNPKEKVQSYLEAFELI